MKTIKTILLGAALAVSGMAFAADASSYVLYWNLSSNVTDPFSTLSSGTYYAAIGVTGTGASGNVYLKNESGNTYQIAMLTTSDSGYTVTYPNTSALGSYIAGYVTGSETDVSSYSYYLAILDSAHKEITTLSATSYAGSDLINNGSLMAYNQSSSGTPTSIAGFTAAVPEPTSGLLMLLGLAGLALRRKRA